MPERPIRILQKNAGRERLHCVTTTPGITPLEAGSGRVEQVRLDSCYSWLIVDVDQHDGGIETHHFRLSRKAIFSFSGDWRFHDE